jgi:translocation and assembly module TamB
VAGARSIAVGSFRTVSVAVVFAAALLSGLVIHLDVVTFRRAIASHVNAILATTFAGKISIERIGRVSLAGVDDVRVTIDDPSGARVIVADGVRGRIATMTLLRSLFASAAPLAIELTSVTVRDADVAIDDDDSGELRLAKAFARKPGLAAAPASTPGRGVSFSIGNIAITHGRVHGQPRGAPAIDADLDALAASLSVVPGSTTLDVGRVDVTTRGMPHDANAKGVARATLALPAPSGGAVGVHAWWSGTVGSIAQTVTFSYDGTHIDAVVDAPAVDPAHVRLLWADSPIEAPTSLHAEAHGALTALDVRLHVGAADGTVDVLGSVSLGDDESAKLHIDARSIDLKAIVEASPPSNLALSGDAVASVHADGSLTGDATLEVARGTVANVDLPAVTIHATTARDDVHGLTADATVTPHEAGADVRADIHVRPKGASLEITYGATASVARLDAVAPLGPLTHGRASATVRGTFDVASRRIDAKGEARASAVARGSIRVGSMSLTATAAGPMGAPSVVANLGADDLAAGTTKIQSIRATAAGTLPNLHATVAVRARDIPAVDARADVSLESATTLRNVDATLARNGERAHVSVAALKIASSGVDAENALLDGVGAPARVTLRTSPHAMTLRAVSAGLDIGRLARLLGVHETIDGDTAAFDIDATLRDGGADGHIGAKVSRCTIRGVGDVSGTVEANLRGRRAVGTVHVALGDIASLDATFKHVELGAGSSPIGAIRAAWGSLDFSGRGDLAKLRSLFPNSTASIGELTGAVVLEGHVVRESSTDDTPELNLSGYTSGLVVGAATVGDAPPRWRITGTDVGVNARIDGASGAAELSLRVQDAKGVLVSIDAKASDLPYSKLLETPQNAMALVEHAPLQGRVDIPRRSAADFPEDLALGDAKGDVTATFIVAGTFGKPSVDGSINLDHGRSKFAPLETPLDLVAAIHYDSVRADVKIGAEVRKRQVVDADLVIDAAFADLLDTERQDPMPWTAKGTAHIDRFPLQAIGTLDDREVRGEVNGDLEVDGIHDNGSAKASLDVAALTIADVKYPKASLQLSVDGVSLKGSARIEQTDGFAEAHASAGTQWGRAIAPRIDGTHPITVSLTAKAFRASAFLPFASGILTELDGRIDGDAMATFDPIAKKATSHGTLTLSDGQLEIAAFGGQLSDVAATLAWTPDGIVQIPKLTARVSSGEVDASGTVRLDGLALASAHFVVDVPKKKRVPLTVEGIQVATVDGHFVLDATTSGADHAIHATVDVPTLHADLPVTGTRTAQSLGTMAHVTVGVRGHDGVLHAVHDEAHHATAAKPTGSAAAPVTVSIKLGSDVEIRRGTDLKVSLEGTPTVSIGAATRVSGQIRLPRGSIDVDGKPFTIEKGTVTFVGDDPTNPQIVLTAEWPAPEGTTVYADFVGPLQTGKVSLRSDPPHTRSEILALLLYGTADGQSGSTSDSAPPTTTAAAGAAGGVATQPVNRILDDFGLAGGVTTKIDTSTANPRPEVEFQIARDISLQIAWVLGAPPPGTNPDTTLVTFDWRFLQRWSLETTVGDAGTSILDVVWKYHY